MKTTQKQRLDDFDDFEDSEGINVTIFINDKFQDRFESFLGHTLQGTGHGIESWAIIGQGDDIRNTVYQFRFEYAGSAYRFGKAWGKALSKETD